MAIRAGGYYAVDPLYQIPGGATLAITAGKGPPWWTIYYIILLLFTVLALVLGRRAGCCTICRMAPFTIIGRWLPNRVRWPALRLVTAPDKFSDCLTCTRECPMSLNVHEMVNSGDMDEAECILCGTCVDGCRQDAVHHSFSGGGTTQQAKLALILFTYELAQRLDGTGVTANCLHPGPGATDAPLKDPDLSPFGQFMYLLVRLFFQSPEKGVETSVYLASSAEVARLRGKCFIKKRAVASSPESYDEGLAWRLWATSAQLTGLVE